MKMNIKLQYLLASVVITLGSVACNNKVEPLEVVAPTIPVATESLATYKASLFSRPVVMGFLSDWEATNGITLASTPDSLDILAVGVKSFELTEAMKADLAIVQSEKLTTVLLRADINALDLKAAQQLKKETKAKRKALIASWPEDNMPSEEEQASLISKLEQEIANTYADMTSKEAAQLVKDAMSSMETNKFSGLCFRLPESFSVITEEVTNQILDNVVKKCGGIDQPYLAIETPFEGGRAAIEKATWVIYNRTTIEKRLSYYTNEATLWSNSRYIPSVNIASSDNVSGFKDSKIFSTGDATPCSEEVINWLSPNRAGVAYYGIESDANYSKEANANYPNMRKLINLVGSTK